MTTVYKSLIAKRESMRGEWQFAPHPFYLGILSKVFCRQSSGSFAPMLRRKSLEIHKVFRRLSRLA